MSGDRWDPQAVFEELYLSTRTDVLAYLMRRLRDREAAADVMADTYLVAWQKLDTLPTGAEARPWLFGVARNLLLKDFRRAKVASATAERLASELARGDALGGTDDAPRRDELHDALAELTPLDKEIISLAAWEGMTPREIAVVLGKSPNVVRIRLHRARARLRRALATGSAAACQAELLGTSN